MSFHKINLLFLLLGCTAWQAAAQQPAPTPGKVARGTVCEEGAGGTHTPLMGASVRQWGARTLVLADSLGRFSLPLADSLPQKIITSMVGMEPDTFDVQPVAGGQPPAYVMGRYRNTETVSIVGRRPTHFISSLHTEKTEILTTKELGKAACCNLGESFETNPSVDVNFSDAVTGAKQIQMLGLSGVYAGITIESLPLMQGLGRTYGLNYIPGPWVQSIMVSKGPGPVVNGYESLTGQINIELKKPDFERLHFNAYANNWGRYEANFNLSKNFERNTPQWRGKAGPWSTALLTHISTVSRITDNNNDGFLDQPLQTQINLANRWHYVGPKGFVFQAGVHGVNEERLGGQVGFAQTRDPAVRAGYYGITIGTQRVETYAKFGYINPRKIYQGFGIQTTGLFHQQNSYFGQPFYFAIQRRGYVNAVYQSIIGTTDHSFRTGFSYLLDDYNENYWGIRLLRTELVPGAFFEYTYKYLDRFDAVLGMRIDKHNLFGWYYTPRVHLRWQATEMLTLRASAGKGYRTANVFAENSALLASGRMVMLPGAQGLPPLQNEEAWNYGFNITQKFTLWGREGTLGFDAYRTDFVKQVVVDLDDISTMAMFYNLTGPSFANNIQVDLQYELLPNLDLRAAYKWYDVRQTMTAYMTTGESRLLRRQMVPEHRVLVNLAYELPRWKFDATLQWYGPQRLMETTDRPVQFQQPAITQPYTLVLAQVTKIIRQWEVYVGGENLLNFMQPNPVVSADNPNSPYFDTSFSWAPIIGRTIYVGLRYSIQ